MSTKRVSEMTDDEIRDLAGSGRAPYYAAQDTAQRTAEAVRLLNYLTLPGDGAPGLEYPSHVYDIAASLKVAVQRMPQLFGQMSVWLGQQYAAGKVAHDSGQDAADQVRQVRYWLDTAETCAQELAGALDKVHNASAGLKAAER